MLKTQNVNGALARGDAVLSQSFPEPADQFLAREPKAFDQADDHPHIRQHPRRLQPPGLQHHPFPVQFHLLRQFVPRWPAARGRGRGWLRLLGTPRRTAAAGAGSIETFLLPSPDDRLVVRGTTLPGSLSAMVLPAAERTTQVHAASVPGMREKPDPTGAAVNGARLELRMGLEDGIQRALIFLEQRLRTSVLMPILAKREALLDGDDKKAKRAAILSTVSDTPSSYLSEAHASRGRTRFFMRRRPRSANTASTTAPSPIPDASDSACPARRDSLRAKSCNRYLEERSLFFFPSSGPTQLSKGGSAQASVKG